MLAYLSRLIATFEYGAPADERLWHKCAAPFFPRRTVDGDRTSIVGQTWRRLREDGKWEYKQGEESYEDWRDRQL